ncbi:MAG: hypothetical protein R3B72_52010 [Polyangiaceae bacterium]
MVKNPAYLVVILLSRVVTRLGGVPTINPKTIEGLFATDLAFLQNLYNEINQLPEAAGPRGLSGHEEVPAPHAALGA